MPDGCDWGFELSPLVNKSRVKMQAQRDVIAQCIYLVYKHTPQLPHTHVKYLHTTTRKQASKNENRIRNPTKPHKKTGYRWERRVESGYHILNKRRQRPSRRERGRGKEKKSPPIVVLCKRTPCAAHATHPATPSKRVNTGNMQN